MLHLFNRVALALALAVICAISATAQETEPATRQIMGWVEAVRLEPWGFKFRARMDTGAKTSSMSARQVELFEKDDERWVRFIFDYQEDKGSRKRHVTIQQPVLRMVRIKRHGDRIQERPVVRMDLCINGQIHAEEFSLIDRTSLNYPVLLGRDALKDIALIDPAATFLTRPDCGGRKKRKKKAAEQPAGGS